MSGGWGLGPWGVAPWGTGIFDPLRLMLAFAIRDNAVRLYFNQPPLYTGVLDDGDASDPERFSVVAIAGTYGADEKPARDVTPVAVERPLIANYFETILDVIVDRPLSPYPARYIVSANGIRSVTLALLDPAYTSFEFFGISRGLPTQKPDESVASRDIANIQNMGSTIGSIPAPIESLVLGTLGVDSQGDLAYESGVTAYKKRIVRRCLTNKGGFAHLPEYGVSVPTELKQLAKAGIRETIAADAESQILQEPETKSVSCRFVQDAEKPDLWWLQIRATTIYGDDVVEVSVPFLSIG